MPNTASAQAVPILFTHYGDNWLRGSEHCLLSLLSTLDQSQFQPIVWTNNRALVTELQALNIPVYHTAFSLLLGWQAPKYDLINFIRLVRQGRALVRRHNIQLLHANSGAPVQWLCWVARLCRIPLLAHLHSAYPLRDRLTLGLYNASLCVGVSQAVIASLLDDGLPQNRSAVIHNGINTDLPSQNSSPLARPNPDLNSEPNATPRPFVLASIGSLIHRKGFDLLLSACHQLQQQGHAIELHIFGDGPERAALLKQAEQLGLMQQVIFCGEVTDAAARLHHGFDAYVSGARDEAFGLVLAEAGLAGLPVIAPNVGGIAEVVVDQYSGLLVEPERADQIAKAIEQLITEPSRAAQLGHNGQQWVKQHFSRHRMADDFTQHYHQLLDPTQTSHWHVRWLGLFSVPRAWRKLWHVFWRKETQPLNSDPRQGEQP